MVDRCKRACNMHFCILSFIYQLHEYTHTHKHTPRRAVFSSQEQRKIKIIMLHLQNIHETVCVPRVCVCVYEYIYITCTFILNTKETRHRAQDCINAAAYLKSLIVLFFKSPLVFNSCKNKIPTRRLALEYFIVLPFWLRIGSCQGLLSEAIRIRAFSSSIENH